MIQKIADRLHREEKGFTLIELMVVVLIIAILIAIAIPTFLGARRRAQDRAAQSSDRNILTAAKTIFSDKEDYADATVAELNAGEPAITSVANNVTSDGPNKASVDGGTSPSLVFVAAVYSKAKHCWFVRDSADTDAAETQKGTWFNVTASDGTDCTVTNAPAVNAGAEPAPGVAGWHRNPGDVPLP